MNEKPIRIAQIMGRMDRGGVEGIVTSYYRVLDKSRVQFDFFYDETSSFPQKEELLQMGARLYPLPPYTRAAAYQKALCAVLRQNRYTVVHAHISTMSIFPLFAAWRAGVPVRICHNHSTAHRGEGKKTLLKYLLRPFATLFATDYFACGAAAARWMYGARRCKAGKVHIMPNAVQADSFRYSKQARSAVRDTLDIAQDATVVGHVGRFTYAKNHSFLLEVFAALRKQCPRAVLLLVGEGERAAELRAQVDALGLCGSVRFAGAVSNPAPYYSAMDVLCMPSFYEGMPVVPLEAQANGLPCLLSSAVTSEAVLSEKTRQMPLELGAEQWTQRLLELLRCPNREAPVTAPQFELGVQAEKMAGFYLQKQKENVRTVGGEE